MSTARRSLQQAWVEGGPYAAGCCPVHAAGVRRLGPIRPEPHVGHPRFSHGVPDRLRHRVRPGGDSRRGRRGERGLPLGTDGRVSGPDQKHRSYFSRATFRDPDGNSWLLQEVTTRLPGRIDSGVTSFGSASDLASAFRRAEAAHGEHEKRTGQRDENWPGWYAEYMAAEQAGTELPK